MATILMLQGHRATIIMGTGSPRHQDRRMQTHFFCYMRAFNLAFGDEEILDVARTYSAKALKELMPSMLPHLRESVAHALELPLHWRAPRLGPVRLSYESYYFSERTVFFSHDKSANNTFRHGFSAKRTWPKWLKSF